MCASQEVTALQCNKTVRVESHHSHQTASGAKVRAEVRTVTDRRKWPFYQPHSDETHTATATLQLLMCGSVTGDSHGQRTWTKVSISDYLTFETST